MRAEQYRSVLREVFSVYTDRHLDDVIDYIVLKFVLPKCVGLSSYARKRRAKQIGRCPRCFRVVPKFYFTTKCDGVTCVPGISYRLDVEKYIKYGLSEIKT
ncbi:nucleic acid binding protein [Clivia carlavirus A]|uniref:RNA silencing suppressor n=1 Tax=Clivia carlavirus A TaxID=2838077 RepID=A0A8E7KMB3_9VIRU|nr:nucleic acid binding protein [Clivia carlavirus A]QVY19183.1 nucleic acid binding protein [Clivia carlavirus A]